MDAPTAQIIDGKAIADEIRKEIAANVKALQEKYGKAREASPSNRAARHRTAGNQDHHRHAGMIKSLRAGSCPYSAVSVCRYQAWQWY